MSVPLHRRYRIAENDIAHEIIDGEAIIIHFETGNYYSLNGMAAKVWSWLEAGATYGEITNAFQELPSDGPAEINGFVEGLVREGILIHSDEPALNRLPNDAIPVPGSLPFVAPRFDKYNDMKHLLLSDPIHEVDDQRGWPHAPTAN